MKQWLCLLNMAFMQKKIFSYSIGINGVLWFDNVNYNISLWLFPLPNYLKIDYIVQ